MHLLIDDQRNYQVDIVARTARQGKRALQQHDISALYMDHDLGGRESGYDILCWAEKKQLLPAYVVLVTNNPVGRKNMADLLKANGFLSADGFRFCRH